MRAALVTLSVGDHGRQMLDVSGPILYRWAAKLGASFHAIRVETSPFPCGEKFAVREYVERFDRVLYVDADVIPDVARVPNLFHLVPEQLIGAHDDYPRLKTTDWVQVEHDRLCDSQGVPRIAADHAYNSGLVVLSKRHAKFFEPPAKPYQYDWCAEQWWEYINAVRYGLEFYSLDSRLNWQWWFAGQMPSRKQRPDILVRHFAGMSNLSTKDERIRLMRAAAAEAE
jgi:hypothetical protein